MQLNEHAKVVLSAHGVAKRSAQMVILSFVDPLYDLVTEDREIFGVEEVLCESMDEDDFDEIREECSDTENMVGRSVVRSWIAYSAKERRAKLTDAGRDVARALVPLMNWPATTEVRSDG